MFNDNKDFYPTPRELFYKLIDGRIKGFYGKILEPSAGKGDLIEHIEEFNHNRRVNYSIDAIEKDTRLANLLIGKGYSVVWDDFLTYETFKEYDYIFMNPPFSKGVDHVLKALELAENQISNCQLYIIINKETINNAYSAKRKELLQKLNKYNAKIKYIKHAFINSERKTDVEVALINVLVKKENIGKTIYNKIPFISAKKDNDSELKTALSTYVKENSIQEKLNDIERLVLEYKTACDLTKKAFKAIVEKESFYQYIQEVNKSDDKYSDELHLIASKEFSVTDLNTELDRLRRGYWQLILETNSFKNLLTNEAREKINRQLSLAESMEINIPNIKMLLMALNTNKQDIVIDSIVSIFKRITKYHMNQYSTNVHYYNGWKTNSAYKINKKIVIPISSEFDSFSFNTNYDRINWRVREFIDDIVRAFRLIDPNVPDTFTTLNEQEFENDLLRFKMFKKGTVHIWFKRLDLLNKLNYICGIHFNWIPSEEEQKQNPKAREWVAKEFGDVGEVRLMLT